MEKEEKKGAQPYIRKELKKNLKNRHVQLIALGGIIGSSFFLGTGYILSTVGPSAFLAYALGGLIVYMVMLCMGELAVSFPKSGSFVTYASEFISPIWACGVGWTYWINWVAYIPAECIAGGIIMHHFLPIIPVFSWAIFFGLLITVINLSHVGAFGEIEFWLAIIKISAILFFCVAAILIVFGIIHTPNHHGALGFSNITRTGMFPNGKWIVLSTMVMLLVNFQGSEIIGLASSESKHPEKSIPKAVKSVSYRIIALYLIPVFLLTLIYPWEKANLSQSIFVSALNMYGLNWVSGVFAFVVLTAAISCANSGMYGTVRTLYGLALEGMAPRSLKKLNKNSVPKNATLFTLLGIWIFILLSYFFSASSIFAALLSISGFTGAICWISICWSQYNFRKKLTLNGYSRNDLKFSIRGFPILTLAAIWMQILCLFFTLFNPDLRVAFYLGIPALLIPMFLYKRHLKTKKHHRRHKRKLLFEKQFPSKSVTDSNSL